MRVPERAGGVRGAIRRAGCLVALGAALLTACGDTGGESGLRLQPLWQRGSAALGFDGSGAIPPSVQTVEVQVVPTGAPVVRTFAPATGNAIRVDGLRPGTSTVRLFGYDVPYAERGRITTQALPPSFASGPKIVEIAPYALTDAGTFELLAQPFVTGFAPEPGATGVDRRTSVTFVLATAAGAIDQESIEVDVAGLVVVRAGVTEPGASLSACDDRASPPCSPGGAKRLVGFRVSYATPEPYPAGAPVGVSVSAADFLGVRVRYGYAFTTGTESGSGTGGAADAPGGKRGSQ